MAEGRPIVATRVGGIPSLVTPATGVLVALRAAVIAEALVTLAEDAECRDRLGAAARHRFLADYEAVGWARRLKEVYASVLA